MSLQTKWVEELCETVGERGGLEAVRLALERTFGVKHGVDGAKWIAYWKEHRSEFGDH